MVRVERTLTIDRPVPEVFEYLRHVEHGPRYISAQREAHQTSVGTMGVGTTFVTTSGKFPHRDTTFQVVEYEPDRRLAWKALSGARTTTTWGFSPFGSMTRVSFVRVIEVHGLLRLPESLVQELANERVNRELSALNTVLAIGRPVAKSAYLGVNHQ